MFREPAMYQDREAAARALARQLQPYATEDPLVVGIPRGGALMGRIIADELDCELDMCLVRKIGAPTDPGKAIGAVTETGDIHLSPSSWGISRRYIEDARFKELQKIKQRRLMYNKPPVSCHRRFVILVDDGISTGCTMLAAIHAVRAQKPSRIIVAVPVSSQEALAKIRKKADDVVVLYSPKNFMTVAQFYLHFPQITDLEVMQALGTKPMTEADASFIGESCCFGANDGAGVAHLDGERHLVMERAN